jgi:hypothetical protein
MKNPARKKTSRRFRVEFTGHPTKCCSNHLTTTPAESNIVLPGLTCRRSFVVISFANCSVFCIGKAERFCRHEMNDEFYFATAKQIYRIMVSPQAKTLTLLDRLNAAHSNLDIDSLWWPGMSGVAALA